MERDRTRRSIRLLPRPPPPQRLGQALGRREGASDTAVVVRLQHRLPSHQHDRSTGSGRDGRRRHAHAGTGPGELVSGRRRPPVRAPIEGQRVGRALDRAHVDLDEHPAF